MSEQNPFHWEETLTGEALLFDVVARLFYRYPNAEELPWILSLYENDVFSEAPYAADRVETEEGLKHLRDFHKNNYGDGFLEAIQADYLRLFIGPGKVIAPPWESVHFSRERLTFQEQTLDVRNWYRLYNLEPEKLHQEPDDHIGLEISFVAYLAKLALKSLEEQNAEQFAYYLKAQSQFLSEHLLRWGTYWCSLVFKNAQTDFYKGLALLTQGAFLALGAEFGIKTSKEFIH